MFWLPIIKEIKRRQGDVGTVIQNAVSTPPPIQGRQVPPGGLYPDEDIANREALLKQLAMLLNGGNDTVTGDNPYF